ncbi:MAG: hypothetical protein KA184_09385 [Candidatus Hydrogenedentes bacterium]|nr:hypothetical protein [Candidatus Hydrogenedentota bacterium]
MNTLLDLQALDLDIERLREREAEIPKQKSKYEIHRKRLAEELTQSEERCKRLVLEQRENEGEIEQKQAQIKKYEGQLVIIKKNEEYQALLHEIDMLRKQIALREERIIAIMVEQDEARVHLEEDRKRIEAESRAIEQECAKIDQELATVVAERKRREEQRAPMLRDIEPDLLSRYTRIRRSIKTGPAVVPINNEYCSGCHMMVTPQIINELIAGHKIHACSHCGRLLYHADNLGGGQQSAEA